MKSTLCRSILGLALAGILSASAAQATTPPLGSIVLSDRFQISATWRTPDGTVGRATGVRLTQETGYFWFFSPTNIEVVVKVLDACAVNDRFWVFAGGLTDVEVDINVTDLETEESKTYLSPQGTPFQPIQDTNAFAGCGVTRCGQGIFTDLAASPRPDLEIEALALLMSGAIAAPQGVYDRVRADVAWLETQESQGVDIATQYDLQSLILSVDADTRSQIVAGTYRAWDCLNRWYTVEDIDVDLSSVVLRFRGLLNIERVQDDYKDLPGVTYTSTNDYLFPLLPPGFGSLCGWAEGDNYYYFVRWPQPLHYFTSQPGQTPVARGSVSASPAIEALATRCYQEHGIR